MRPKLLEIEGLQSFRDGQTINFETLGETGLFGIFGPTGSGKSTVLDAITFALYGRVKRADRGTQGIINTGMNTAKVAFTFELLKGGVRRTYRVERTYQRKKGSENSCEPKVARLMEITDTGMIPLCDKASEVSGSMEELLGLSHDDFTRAVVLPQNSFQEFLMLDNSKKRDMLERIFFLEEYGRQLLDKLSGKMGRLGSRIDVLTGELNGCADASKEALEAAEKAVAGAMEERSRIEKEYKLLEKKYNEAREVWQLSGDMSVILKEESRNAALKDGMDKKRLALERALKAEGLVEIIRRRRELSGKLSDTHRQLEETAKGFTITAGASEDMRRKLNDLKKEIASEQPRLVSLRTRLTDALDMKTEINKLHSGIRELQDKTDKLGKSLLDKKTAADREKSGLEELEKELGDIERDLRENAAWMLSRDLKEGEPCPVCGSLHHPAPGTYGMEAAADSLYKQEEQIREAIGKKKAFLEKLETESKGLSEENIKIQAYIETSTRQKQEKETRIAELAGAADIGLEIQRADEKLAEYERLEKQYVERLQTLEKNCVELAARKSAMESREAVYSGELEKEEALLYSSLPEKGFEDVEDVERSILFKEEQGNAKKIIEEYDQKVMNVRAQKEMLLKKLGSRSITGEEWERIESGWRDLSASKEECVSRSEVAKSSFEMLKVKHNRWVELDRSYKELTKKYGLLEQIQKLLKAERGRDNSFIDFIAEERLRYIAAKASETLGVMTKYKYALELDIGAGFIIRDNANGGTLRTVTSLSGGETFLTSLSLALALSDQIQLKGQSPLEFFFLDEGFGTLDSDLLDTVIDALERLSRKDRVIGLISHLPELRNRLTRRLIIEPPSMQGSGSKARIEKA